MMSKQMVFDALLSSYKNHLSLGESGKEMISDEGDVAQNHLRADIESEKKMLGVIKPDSYWGEEVGKKESKDGDFWVFDGIDGTANYSQSINWSYGAMLAGSKKK